MGLHRDKHESEVVRERVVDVATEFEGKVTLFVNIASKCGFTKAGYETLNELYSTYNNHHDEEKEKEEGKNNEDKINKENKKKKKQFEIVAIPSNDFGNQEPGN